MDSRALYALYRSVASKALEVEDASHSYCDCGHPLRFHRGWAACSVGGCGCTQFIGGIVTAQTPASVHRARLVRTKAKFTESHVRSEASLQRLSRRDDYQDALGYALQGSNRLTAFPEDSDPVVPRY